MGISRVNLDRLLADLEAVNAIGAEPDGGVTRLAYTEADVRAHAWLRRRMEETGLTVEVDAVGNMFGWATHPGEGAILSGSHLDTVPHGGRYDGTLGTLCALEAVRTLLESGHPPAAPLGVACFAGEESTRFKVGCIGTQTIFGSLTADHLDLLRDDDGVTLREAMGRAGCRPEALGTARRSGRWAKAFLEVHVDQGPLVRDLGQALGIVTAIAAPDRFEIDVTGVTSHSGASEMGKRRDALAAAAEIVLLVERLGHARAGRGIVTTVGRMTVSPNFDNRVAGFVRMGLDLRGFDQSVKDEVAAEIEAGLREIAERRQVAARMAVVWKHPGARVPEPMVQLLEGIAREADLHACRIVSRSGHDAMFMSLVADIGMLFVRNPTGLSHNPQEAAEPADIFEATTVLAHALARLSSEPEGGGVWGA